MAGPEFFQTYMGRQFYEGTVPRIAKAAKAIADTLPRLMDAMDKLVEKLEVQQPSEQSVRRVQPEDVLLVFSADDVQNLRENLSLDECQEMLDRIRPQFIEQMVERGLKVMSDLLDAADRDLAESQEIGD